MGTRFGARCYKPVFSDIGNSGIKGNTSCLWPDASNYFFPSFLSFFLPSFLSFFLPLLLYLFSQFDRSSPASRSCQLDQCKAVTLLRYQRRSEELGKRINLRVLNPCQHKQRKPQYRACQRLESHTYILHTSEGTGGKQRVEWIRRARMGCQC